MTGAAFIKFGLAPTTCRTCMRTQPGQLCNVSAGDPDCTCYALQQLCGSYAQEMPRQKQTLNLAMMGSGFIERLTNVLHQVGHSFETPLPSEGSHGFLSPLAAAGLCSIGKHRFSPLFTTFLQEFTAFPPERTFLLLWSSSTLVV